MDETWKTAISKVEQNSILLRGYRIEQLIGAVSFGEAVYLTLRGELPKRNEGRMIEAILVAVIDHGPTPPSSLTARTIATTGAELNAAVAGGILAISHYHGGAIEECMQALHEAVEFQRQKNVSLQEAAQWMVQSYRRAHRRIAGYGHRLHTDDPRTKRLFELSDELGLTGPYIQMATAIESAMKQAYGKDLPINADGAIAAILCDMDFPPVLADAFFMMARVPGLVAHVVEERSRFKPMRRLHRTDIEYDGPTERQFRRISDKESGEV